MPGHGKNNLGITDRIKTVLRYPDSIRTGNTTFRNSGSSISQRFKTCGVIQEFNIMIYSLSSYTTLVSGFPDPIFNPTFIR